eukprot:TRINITY_DN3559_c0_g1_i1.p1 TRINITY_DN3559_c0_g1~~TRINITY_DN3559_c0_g1_i1.p1  ORF type:complete len:347 (+),score=82.38 TRINITY_DN3559_c0_g1_i1:69-1109(+)
MKDAELRIVTEQQNITLFPGMAVIGTLHVIVNKAIKPRSIEIKLKGKMKTHVERGSGDNKRHYYETNKFLKFENTVWRPNENGAGTEILPGDHYFPFQFRLPDTPDLPPSMSISDCSIQYRISSKIDLAWQIDPTAYVDLRVTGFYNADDTKYGEPVTGEDMKTICCMCCASDPITCRMTLPRGSLILGESMRAALYVTNGSDKEIKSVFIELRRKVSYKAKGYSEVRNIDEKLAEYPSKIDPFTRDLEFFIDFRIPDFVPSDYDTGTIVSIKNYIVVTLRFPGMTLDLDVTLPMFIGTIRPSMHAHAVQPQYQMPPPVTYQTAPMAGPSDGDQISQYPSAPPSAE